MRKSKKTRDKGKISLSRAFQKLEKGDKVAVIQELSETRTFPDRIHGQSGTVDGKRGRSYIIAIKGKKYIINPIHLKKLK